MASVPPEVLNAPTYAPLATDTLKRAADVLEADHWIRFYRMWSTEQGSSGKAEIGTLELLPTPEVVRVPNTGNQVLQIAIRKSRLSSLVSTENGRLMEQGVLKEAMTGKLRAHLKSLGPDPSLQMLKSIVAGSLPQVASVIWEMIEPHLADIDLLESIDGSPEDRGFQVEKVAPEELAELIRTGDELHCVERAFYFRQVIKWIRELRVLINTGDERRVYRLLRESFEAPKASFTS